MTHPTFTLAETNLMVIYNPGTRLGLIEELKAMMKYLSPEERELHDLTPLPPNADTDGPARMYALAGGIGRFGLITPLSNHFCATCNRLRVTSDGRLRTCLFDDREYRLAPILRHPRLDDETLLRVLRRATLRKPIGAHLLEKRRGAVARKTMTAIGG